MRLFAEQGAKVVILDIGEDQAQALVFSLVQWAKKKTLANLVLIFSIHSIVYELNQSGYTSTFIKTDITKAADWKNATDKTLAKFSKIDILVNNAGWTYRRKDSLEVTEAEYDRKLRVQPPQHFVWL